MHAATRDIARSIGRALGGTARMAEGVVELRQTAGETGGAATQVIATFARLAQQVEGSRRKVGEVLGGLRAA